MTTKKTKTVAFLIEVDVDEPFVPLREYQKIHRIGTIISMDPDVVAVTFLGDVSSRMTHYSGSITATDLKTMYSGRGGGPEYTGGED